MGPTIVATVGALLGVLLGGLLTYFVERRLRHKEAFEETSFRVYMMLLDLIGLHESICSDEMFNRLSPPERRRHFDQTRWLISDELRKVELPELENIMQVIHGDFPTEKERNEALGKVIDQLGNRVNPKYKKVAKQISQGNETAMFSDAMDYFHRRQKTRLF